MRERRKSFVACFVSAVALWPVIACSVEVVEHPSPPTSTQVELQFPSTAVAVATESVQVFVFDKNVAGSDCQSLVQKKKIGGQLPAALLEGPKTTPCDILGAGKGTLSALGYGSRSFLAVTQRGGKDFFLGCTSATLSETGGPVNITLAPVGGTIVVPPTTCTSLTQKCTMGC